MKTYYIFKANRRKNWTSLRYVGSFRASQRSKAVEQAIKKVRDGRFFAFSPSEMIKAGVLT